MADSAQPTTICSCSARGFNVDAYGNWKCEACWRRSRDWDYKLDTCEMLIRNALRKMPETPIWPRNAEDQCDYYYKGVFESLTQAIENLRFLKLYTCDKTK